MRYILNVKKIGAKLSLEGKPFHNFECNSGEHVLLCLINAAKGVRVFSANFNWEDGNGSIIQYNTWMQTISSFHIKPNH